VDARAVRGQRVFCSNRGSRGGCGRTFSFFLAEILPRHTFTASWLWQWLIQWLAGASLKAAVEKLRLPFALNRSIGCGANYASNRTACVRCFVASKDLPPARNPIRCCRRRNISGPSSRTVSALRLLSNFTFSALCSIEVLPQL
jgi:hypothetical protein